MIKPRGLIKHKNGCAHINICPHKAEVGDSSTQGHPGHTNFFLKNKNSDNKNISNIIIGICVTDKH